MIVWSRSLSAVARGITRCSSIVNVVEEEVRAMTEPVFLAGHPPFRMRPQNRGNAKSSEPEANGEMG